MNDLMRALHRQKLPASVFDDLEAATPEVESSRARLGMGADGVASGAEGAAGQTGGAYLGFPGEDGKPRLYLGTTATGFRSSEMTGADGKILWRAP
jgi:hypothetical protein